MSEYFVPEPVAESFLMEILDHALKENFNLRELDQQLQEKTSTRLFDFIDYFSIENKSETENQLKTLGFIQEMTADTYRVFIHPKAKLPRLVISDTDLGTQVAVKVDSIAEYLMVRGVGGLIEGTPFSAYRRCMMSSDNQVSFFIVERRVFNSIDPVKEDLSQSAAYVISLEQWMSRPRGLDSEEEAMRLTIHLAQELINQHGRDMAAWIILEGERKFWQSKNKAGQIQKNRQDQLGMGWANHDHHTFRSSRSRFHQLVRFFEMLGFHLRERYYAGKEAGWGAQIVENERAGLVCFLDVDLYEDELDIDFAHVPLQEREKLGTIGLWCALHGDSILASGMHHLEAQFLFEKLNKNPKS